MAAAGQRPWGWHALDRRWAELVVAGAGVREGDLVLDIGAGRGALTRALVASGARVIAVELHPARAAFLRTIGGVTVVEVDASDLRLPRRPFRVVASPPYAITTPLLRRLLHPGSRLLAADLVLQRQAARRWAARGAAGYDVFLGPAVPRRAFRPRPACDSVVLRVRRR